MIETWLEEAIAGAAIAAYKIDCWLYNGLISRKYESDKIILFVVAVGWIDLDLSPVVLNLGSSR